MSETEIFQLRRKGQLAKTVELRPRLIDLFAGAGGMTAGFTHFENHVFEPVWANDFNDDAAETYKANFGHMTPGDIVWLLDERTRTRSRSPRPTSSSAARRARASRC